MSENNARLVEAWAAPGQARTIDLIEAPPYKPGPEEGRKIDSRIEQDADELWDALRGGLPVATLVQLREHFRDVAARWPVVTLDREAWRAAVRSGEVDRWPHPVDCRCRAECAREEAGE